MAARIRRDEPGKPDAVKARRLSKRGPSTLQQFRALGPIAYGFFVNDPGASGSIPLSAVAADFAVLWPALAALFFSHALSFHLNFIGRREYEGRQVSQQMVEPYKRIIVMHVTIIFGGFLVLALGSAVPALMLLIVLKIAADVRAHLHERGGRAGFD
jgi:hypothetical protein